MDFETPKQSGPLVNVILDAVASTLTGELSGVYVLNLSSGASHNLCPPKEWYKPSLKPICSAFTKKWLNPLGLPKNKTLGPTSVVTIH
jgi:hypothetical protein